jgi:probable HAF family extracellular repeat protein
MKIIIGAVFLAATCLFYTNADGQVKETADAWGWGHKVKPTEIDFTVEIINSGIAELAGVNRHGEITGVVASGTQYRAAFVNRQDRMTVFDCLQFDRPDETSTWPTAINNDGTILGGCGSWGFVRRKGGALYQFSVPGADSTTPYGMNDREDVVGEFNAPSPFSHLSGWYRAHSFLRKADGQVTTLAAPPLPDDLGFPHSLTRTVAAGINNRGQIVGTSSTIFTPSNEGGLWKAFLYDNGQFTDLPEQAGPIAINNDGTILAQRPTGQYVLYDDGRVYTIALPDEYKWSWIAGLTDKGELFGKVRTGSGATLRHFDVIATPK